RAPDELRVGGDRLALAVAERLALARIHLAHEEAVVANRLAGTQRRAPEITALPYAAGSVGRRDVADAGKEIVVVGHARSRRAPLLPDRKSTRLNSSHLGISYAVF